MRRPAVSSRDSGAATAMIASANAAKGTASQKMRRQLTNSTAVPPTSGPMARAIADTAAQMPTARGRSSGGNARLAIARESASNAAPPAPCTTRPAISWPTEPAVAQITEPAPNVSIPSWKIRFRPTMSPSRPRVTTSAAKVSR